MLYYQLLENFVRYDVVTVFFWCFLMSANWASICLVSSKILAELGGVAGLKSHSNWMASGAIHLIVVIIIILYSSIEKYLQIQNVT